MTLDRDDLASADPGEVDELDRLRLALLRERSRAERAEQELAALRARHEASSGPKSASGSSFTRPFRRRR